MKRNVLPTISAIVLVLAIFFLILPIIRPFEEILPKEHRPIVYIGGKYIPLPIFWLTSFFLFLGTIFLSYWFVSRRLEKKIEKMIKVIERSIETKKQNKRSIFFNSDRDLILRFLSYGERKVIEKLIEKRGVILQAELSRIEGMNKLKAHRAVQELLKKGLVRKEKIGKTFKIYLNEDVKEFLVKE
jgi:uncharacterized membrane protein